MDALKSAGRAIIRSPSMAKQSWTAGRHRKLPENWTDTRETILEGMTFNLRHLGMTLVDQPKGEDLSAAAVKRIVATAKASGKKPQKVALKISPQGIVLHDSLTNKLLEKRLHIQAQAVALTVAQAFTVAFELWQVAKEEKGKRAKSGSAGEASSSSHSERSNSLGSLKGTDVATDNLLDFEDGVNTVVETNGNVEEEQLDNHRPSETNNNPAWEIEDDLDEAFSSCALDSYGSYPGKVEYQPYFSVVVLITNLALIHPIELPPYTSARSLAVSRTNPQVLDIGVTPQDWLIEPDWDSANGNSPSGLSPFGDNIFGF
ncbi:Low density lipoprotein receptor adapter protein 1-B [Collichthys lucidus]|uniref:Low density lipoprotein receptor adapter protein 1-B n=1 Tax=Collichthys lucidus TaxID=240159 RepID=A0A4U5VK53_COLLU|nr:Low density lipoprotein receptor adapter protein 1-B [Collichthys lucidus]